MTNKELYSLLQNLITFNIISVIFILTLLAIVYGKLMREINELRHGLGLEKDYALEWEDK